MPFEYRRVFVRKSIQKMIGCRKVRTDEWVNLIELELAAARLRMMSEGCLMNLDEAVALAIGNE